MGEKLVISTWTQDEAGPYQTKPYPGASWQPEGQPLRQPHEYIRNGTAKILTLFHPLTGQACIQGVTSSTNAILHPWLQEELTQILQTLPAAPVLDAETNQRLWLAWQEGLSAPVPLPEVLPTLRMFLIWDNLKGHYTTTIVSWLVEHGILPLYTPVASSWLNMAESMQRILVGRGLAGQNPETPQQIINSLEGVARGWNLDPTPFEWGGKRFARRHALGCSGACSQRPIHRHSTLIQKWQRSRQKATSLPGRFLFSWRQLSNGQIVKQIFAV